MCISAIKELAESVVYTGEEFWGFQGHGLSPPLTPLHILACSPVRKVWALQHLAAGGVSAVDDI